MKGCTKYRPSFTGQQHHNHGSLNWTNTLPRGFRQPIGPMLALVHFRASVIGMPLSPTPHYAAILRLSSPW